MELSGDIKFVQHLYPLEIALPLIIGEAPSDLTDENSLAEQVRVCVNFILFGLSTETGNCAWAYSAEFSVKNIDRIGAKYSARKLAELPAVN